VHSSRIDVGIQGPPRDTGGHEQNPVALPPCRNYTADMTIKQYELIDCLVHLQDPAFEGALADVVDRAIRAGVQHFVCPSASETDWPVLLDICSECRSVIPCFGLAPQSLGTGSRDWLHKLGLFLKIVPSGVGLIGLDFSSRGCDKQGQQSLFVEQLRLARQWGRPVMVHSVRAWDCITRIITEQPPQPGGLLVCHYHGPMKHVESLLDSGAFFLFSGGQLLDNSGGVARYVAAVPHHRLLIATAAPHAAPPRTFGPYLRLMPGDQPVNEPANLPHILQGAAEVLNLAPEQLASILNHNSLSLFGSLIQTE